MKTNKFLLFISLIFFSCNSNKELAQYSNRERVKKELQTITRKFGYRNYLNIKNLNKVADYIHSEFAMVCDTVYFQEYTADNRTYKNVVASIGVENKKRIVIGAHYDACGEQEGADDNASGTVGVLELARLLSKEKLNYRIDFVAYTLEEPPFFDTKEMGSYIHAKTAKEEKQNIKGMICLEMIGYFNDSVGSQTYPIKALKAVYGQKGDFITIVEKMNSGRFSQRFGNLMKKQGLIETKSFRGPKALQGIDFSDHRNYWEFGYDALMITNTAFYRNDNYHQITDKLETLDIERMCRVIDQVYLSVLEY